MQLVDLFLLQSFDDVFEPKLDELQVQLKQVGGSVYDLLCEQLIDRLTSLSSPDDLFDLFSILRGLFFSSSSVFIHLSQVKSF